MTCENCNRCACGDAPKGPRDQLLALLLQAGFAKTKLPTLGPSGYLKRMKVREMPYLMEHVVPTSVVFEENSAEIEYCPETGMVALCVQDSRYFEEPVDALSEEGRGLLRDAGAAV